MKIKFLKPFRFIGNNPDDGSDSTVSVEHIVDLENDESAQWLIDNGFAEEVKEAKWWRPKSGEEYYFIDDSGYTKCAEWQDDFWEVDRYRMGNVFKTEKAAERYCDYQKAVVTVRQDEGVLTPKQVNELIKNEDLACYVGYMGNRGNEEVLCGCTMSFDDCWMPVGVILFDSEAHADSSLRKHPDEWKIIADYDWSRE